MTWQPLLFPAIAACLWVTVPGFLALSGWRAGWFLKALYAPLVSVGIIVITAIISQAVGVAWGPMPVGIVTLLLCGVSWVPWIYRRFSVPQQGGSPAHHRTGVGSHRGNDSNVTRRANTASSVARFARVLTSLPVMLVVAILGYWALMLRHVRNFLQIPYAFGQQYDNVFHLNVIRGIVDTGRASSLTLQEHIKPESTSLFYPGAWHDIASLTLASVQSTHVAIGTNATIIAALLIIWPTSIIALLKVALPRDLWKYSILPGGVALAAFPAFPFHFLDFGVLYPNFLGYCLAPSLVALFIMVVSGPLRRRLSGPFIFLAGILGSAGTALAHPTAALVVMLFCSAFVLVELVRAFVAGQWTHVALRAVMALALCSATVVAWARIRPSGASADTWTPNLTVTQAIGTTVIHHPVSGVIQWSVGVLVLTGLWAAVRRSIYPLIVFWGISAALYIVAASFTRGPLRTALVGVWYSDPERLYGLLGLTTVPLAIAGLGYLAYVTSALLSRLHRRLRYSHLVAALASALVALGTVIATQATPAMDAKIDNMERFYSLTGTSNTVNTQEMIFIETLPDILPENATVWTDAWRGEGLIYAFSGINVTGRHMDRAGSGNASNYVRDHLNEIDSDPKVCNALDDLGVSYIVHFEGRNVNGADIQRPGLTHLQKTDGLTVIHHRGNAFLYRVDGCGRE